jgi:hypothetical protein
MSVVVNAIVRWKIAVLAPMPIARLITTKAAKPHIHSVLTASSI